MRRFVGRRAHRLIVDEQVYDLDKLDRIHILGLGKAARAMTAPLAESLADRAPRGLLIPKQAIDSCPSRFRLVPGGHPVPDQNSLRAGRLTLALAQGLDENDLLICLLLICLISGGGSALMSLPHPGLRLDDLKALTRILLACGAGRLGPGPIRGFPSTVPGR